MAGAANAVLASPVSLPSYVHSPLGLKGVEIIAWSGEEG